MIWRTSPRLEGISGHFPAKARSTEPAERVGVPLSGALPAQSLLLPCLLENFDDHAGSDRAATLADREAQ